MQESVSKKQNGERVTQSFLVKNAKNGKSTLLACYIGYISQAIVNNFAPLLFVTFASLYSLSLEKISLLITVNFFVQLLLDLLSALFLDKIGYRLSSLLACFFSFAGLLLLGLLPSLLPNAYLGILISVIVYASGGGLLEVLLSPIVEAVPNENKEKSMSFLHSFYSWGQAGVIFLSTAFFFFFGVSNWPILSCLWAILPFLDLILFLFVPLYPLQNEKKEDPINAEGKEKSLFRSPYFYVFMLMMFASGASELAISQWASTFVEKGLGLEKAIGDLAGPMAFALLMGSSRLLYGKLGEKIDKDKCMMGSAIALVYSYLLIALCPSEIVSLLISSLAGFAVGVCWPLTFSKASSCYKGEGSALFSLLALAGDLGAMAGPSFAGLFPSLFADNLRMGILFSSLFPLLLALSLLLEKRIMKKKASLA